MTDFSSPEYWARRFEQEVHNPFEWLADSSPILPLVSASIRARPNSAPRPLGEPIRLLHFGCGTSTLGKDIESALAAENLGSPVDLVNSDYVAESLFPQNQPLGPSVTKTIMNIDVLSPTSLAATSPASGWDVLVDKSTADAISCGPDIHYESEGQPIAPLVALCKCLARVTRPGARWVCVSYSHERFPFLANADDIGGDIGLGARREWRVLEKKLIATTFVSGGRRVKDANGDERIVHEPETGVWAYILERVGDDDRQD